MYRLTHSRSLSQNNFKILTSPRCWDLCCGRTETHRSFALFCINNLERQQTAAAIGTGFSTNIFTTRRPQSTTPNADLLPMPHLKKRKRTKGHKFAELIAINGGELLDTKTSVQKLKSRQLTEFIQKPRFFNNDAPHAKYTKNNVATTNYTVVKLEADDVGGEEAPVLFVGQDAPTLMNGTSPLEEIILSYKMFKEINVDFRDFVTEENVEFLDHNVIATETVYPEEELEQHLDEESLDSIDINSATVKQIPVPKATGGKSKHHKSAEHEHLARQKSLSQNLFTYLEICVNNNMINRGLATLIFYRMRCKRFKSKVNIIDIRLYNILLAGYADKANIGKVQEIMAILMEDKIMGNAQTYAEIFQCLGRHPQSTEISKMSWKYRQEAEINGITLNDIMNRSKFVNDQREIVLTALRRIEPQFEPQYTPPSVLYSNVLLNHLNQHVRPITEIVDLNSTEVIAGSEIMNSKNGFTKERLVSLANEQLKVEMDSVITVKSVEKFPALTEAVLKNRKKLTELQQQWRTQFMVAYSRDLNSLRAQTHSKGNRSISLFPYLRTMEPEQYLDILMHEIRTLAQGSETFSPTVGYLYRQIGQKVQYRYHMERKKRNGILDKTNAIYADYCQTLSGHQSSDNPRQCWQRLVYHSQTDGGASMNIYDRVWPLAVLVAVGRFLYQILMRDIKIDINHIRNNAKPSNPLPAFYTLFRNDGKYVKEEVKPHPVLAKLFRASQQETLTFDSNAVPMLCPPQPWSTPNNGGYLLARSELIRLPQMAYQQWDLIHKTDPSHMFPALDSLNQLASIPWKVNTTVLDVILEVFNAGGSKSLDVPLPPSALDPNEFTDPPTSTDGKPSKSDVYNKFRQKLLFRRKQSEMYSLWCDTLYRLSLANHYRDKIFWLPHNMDFRGRVYPIPPHLNHLGSDLARSLLVFHQARPLGPDGFAWLKLHCINLTGLKKKCGIAERLQYVEEIMDDILDSADNPLTGRRWWAKSDAPWQTLSACMEIANVTGSPDPAAYLSSYPIHQDGSCNGLQHYAALGRDTAGAISVNLAPCDVPQDVYSDVAALVEAMRCTDAANGNEVAKVLEGFIRRVVIKQTVMTTVYGVTRFGARIQIARQLKDIENFPKESVWPASAYLTNKTFESLREMFNSTREIQDWFTHCARLIAAVSGNNVEWVTPLGLPVVQPYNRFDRKLLNKPNQIAENIVAMDLFLKPNVMKQKNAFPPNFVHSLDSSHMMLTSLHCDKRGLTFMSVHDCYWTHACTVPEMNRICREQFVELHSQPILEDLSAYLVNKYSYTDKDFLNDGSIMDSTKRKLNRALRQLPGKGDFDLKNILKSVYFFS